MEVYIDDLVVKSKRKGGLLPNLHETFCNLRMNHVMLNPEKCVFGINTSKLLGFMYPIEVARSTRQKSRLSKN